MKKAYRFMVWLMMCVTAGSVGLTSCSDNDFDTNQYKGGVNLNVFGPCPVARGGQLRFLGSGMDQILQVEIPGCEAITEIERISNGEIRVTVPQTAEPGLLTLKHAGGEIVTKTPISFTEPIAIEEITPAAVKPGSPLTIKGEYLNLIHEVQFSFLTDSVNVADTEFLKHDRHEIVLNVPEGAVSGPISISDGAAMPNVIKSETEIEIVLPSVKKPADLTNYKGGDVVTITGENLDLVRKVLTPSEEELPFTYADNKITFTLPEDITDGAIVAVPESGVKVAIANIGVVVPTELVATPAKGLRAGDILTISGVNMDQVKSVSIIGSEHSAVEEVTATKVTVKWPEDGQSGPVTLNLKSGKSVSIEVATAMPVVKGFNPNPVTGASQLELQGTDLDLISQIVFPGNYTVDVTEATAASVKVIVPGLAESGALTLITKSGEQTTTPSLTVNKPECCFIAAQVSEELIGGKMGEFKIENADKLTGVQINGVAAKFIVDGDRLLVLLPEKGGEGMEFKLISTNGEISYTYNVTPAGGNVRVVMDTPRDLGNWAGEDDGGAFRIYKDGFDGIPAGAVLTFHVESYGETQIKINDSKWTEMDFLEPAQTETEVTWELTQERLDQILNTNDGWSETALVIQGKGTKVNKVTINWY